MAVLVTRPDSKGVELVEMLTKASIAAVHLPLFSIVAGCELNQLPNKINQLKTGDYVVAVSRHAVDFAHQSLQNTGFHWRNDLHYFAVGQQTALHFASQSQQAVHYPFSQECSEGLLQLTPMQQLQDKTVLLLRGNGGRELFPQQVRARGGVIDIAECYQRQRICYDNAEQTSILKRSAIDTLIVTSGEILLNLLDFVPTSEHQWLKSCKLITISKRLEKMAAGFGWTKITIAPKGDNHSLLQHIVNS